MNEMLASRAGAQCRTSKSSPGGHKPALGTEHALARQEELVDCEPFCDTQALEKQNNNY